ncbi:hypothetical protein PVAND_014638 [Polypedilum vanderplanki]|uniref:Secreted protein n=1 Tax=Polypedilum vanderplanki TaxID=319348 RepID=A0A9J6BAI9_POLVA|nr:hypothetical protein PVAND_014638 [Polypedilum vanderplanki]
MKLSTLNILVFGILVTFTCLCRSDGDGNGDECASCKFGPGYPQNCPSSCFPSQRDFYDSYDGAFPDCSNNFFNPLCKETKPYRYRQQRPYNG